MKKITFLPIEDGHIPVIGTAKSLGITEERREQLFASWKSEMEKKDPDEIAELPELLSVAIMGCKTTEEQLFMMFAMGDFTAFTDRH